MFATKPPTPSLEFDELTRAFDRGALATLFGRNPDTVGRWRKAGRVPHTVETVVDRFWWVMHVAHAEQQWPVDSVRYFLLSIQPALGRRPAELVRESDDNCRAVVDVITATPPPADAAEPSTREESAMPASKSPFAELLADKPAAGPALGREYVTPSLAGRMRPIGEDREGADAFRVEYTAKTTHAIPLGGVAVGA